MEIVYEWCKSADCRLAKEDACIVNRGGVSKDS